MNRTLNKWCRVCIDNYPGTGVYHKCEKCLKHSRNSWYKRRYGISLKERDDLLKSLDYKCQICGKFNDKNGKGSLHIDHVHKGIETRGTIDKEHRNVRGVLCTVCNTALGSIERFINDPVFNKQVTNYLTKTVRVPDVPELTRTLH